MHTHSQTSHLHSCTRTHIHVVIAFFGLMNFTSLIRPSSHLSPPNHHFLSNHFLPTIFVPFTFPPHPSSTPSSFQPQFTGATPATAASHVPITVRSVAYQAPGTTSLASRTVMASTNQVRALSRGVMRGSVNGPISRENINRGGMFYFSKITSHFFNQPHKKQFPRSSVSNCTMFLKPGKEIERTVSQPP